MFENVGINFNHPAFAGTGRLNAADSKSFLDPNYPKDLNDTVGHGTAMMGIAVQSDPNPANDYARLAYNSVVVSLKVTNTSNATTLSRVYEALKYAQGDCIKNKQDPGISLLLRACVVHIPAFANILDTTSSFYYILDGFIKTEPQLTIIWSAGNSAAPVQYYTIPGVHPNITIVGGLAKPASLTTTQDAKFSSSNYGPRVDLWAGGDRICSASARIGVCTNPNCYVVLTGSSPASAYAVGVAAVWASMQKSYQNGLQIKDALVKMAADTSYSTPGGKTNIKALQHPTPSP